MKKKYILLSLLPLLLGGCAQNQKEEESNNNATSNKEPTYSFIKVEDVEREYGDFHTDIQAAYLQSDYESVLEFADGTEEKSRPEAIIIDDENHAFLEIADNDKFSDSKVVQLDGDYKFYNAYLAMTYYYRLADSESALADAEVKNFTTCDYGVRNIYIDGVTNVRDVGGHIAENNKRTNQGLLYRGARFNTTAASEFNLEVTENGIKTIKEDLKIKTEIDLRQPSIKETGAVEDNVIEGVNWVNIATKNGNMSNKESYGEVFKVLANKDNYPIYFHCDIGTDRTGLISYMVNSLLGVKQDEVYQDYLFSNFGNIRAKRRATILEDYEKALAEYGYQTKRENVNAYLLDCGVTQEEINSFKEIMLG